MVKRKLDKPTLPRSLRDPIQITQFRSKKIKLDNDEEANRVNIELEKWEVKKNHELEKFIEQERLKKFIALAEYYRCDISNIKGLAELSFKIACDFIDGFKVVEKKQKGRPFIWGEAVGYCLWYEVEQRAARSKISRHAICKLLSQTSPWKSLLRINSKCDVTTARAAKQLYERFIEAKKRSVTVEVSLKEPQQMREKMYRIAAHSFGYSPDKKLPINR